MTGPSNMQPKNNKIYFEDSTHKTIVPKMLVMVLLYSIILGESCGYGLVVEHVLPKDKARFRLPLPAHYFFTQEKTKAGGMFNGVKSTETLLKIFFKYRRDIGEN